MNATRLYPSVMNGRLRLVCVPHYGPALRSPKDLSDEHARAVVGIVACTLGVLRLRCRRRALGLTVLRARGARQRAGRELVGRGKNQRRDELVWEE